MDFTNGFYKAENPVVLEEVKTFLQSMERRGATVKDLDDAIVQLNNVSAQTLSSKQMCWTIYLITPFVPCSTECYKAKGNLNLMWLLIIVIAIFGFPDVK